MLILSLLERFLLTLHCTDKKENNFLIFKEIQKGTVAESYVRKGFLIYDEMLTFLFIYEEAVSLHLLLSEFPYKLGFFFFFISVVRGQA